MARPATGTVHTRELADGTRVFHLRFRTGGARHRVTLHERSGCLCGCGGGWTEPAARNELGNVLARVRAGVWVPPVPSAAETQGTPTFHEYASWWLQAKKDGTLGRAPISVATEADYQWRLARHLLPFFAKYRLDQIDRRLCEQFKELKLREARHQREAIDAGADLRDRRGRSLVPLGPASLRKLIDCLASILDEAIEDGHIQLNPARSRRMNVRVPKPVRTFLEIDELAALLHAAADQDGPAVPVLAQPLGPTAAMVAGLLTQGRSPNQIAAQLGIAKSTVSYHVSRIAASRGGRYAGRRVVIEILGRGGVRASELADLKIGHARLHDPAGARFRIPDAKTEAGVREVQMTPATVEAVIEHIDRLRRLGYPTGADAYLVPNLRGGRIDRQRIGEIVRHAAELASQRTTASGLPPLPNTTPHTLRRTYISIALLANGFDVKWVMSQVGHADSKMTMDVYAQLEQRVDRSHGTNFDRLVEEARGPFYGSRLGHGPQFERRRATPGAGRRKKKTRRQQAGSRMARPGLEPGTPRFSVVCSTN